MAYTAYMVRTKAGLDARRAQPKGRVAIRETYERSTVEDQMTFHRLERIEEDGSVTADRLVVAVCGFDRGPGLNNAILSMLGE